MDEIIGLPAFHDRQPAVIAAAAGFRGHALQGDVEVLAALREWKKRVLSDAAASRIESRVCAVQPRPARQRPMSLDDNFRLLVRLRNSPDLQLRAAFRASVRVNIREARQSAAGA